MGDLCLVGQEASGAQVSVWLTSYSEYCLSPKSPLTSVPTVGDVWASGIRERGKGH